MPDQLLIEFHKFLDYVLGIDWLQRFATLIGGVAVIISLLYYLYNKLHKETLPKNEPKRKFFSDFLFLRRYNKHVIFEHRVFNVRGLRTQGTFMLKLEKVFVELRIARSQNPQQASVNPIFAKAFADNHPIWDFLNFNKKHYSDDTLVLGVIGAPGCGKTTLLQHIALIFASKQHRRYKMSAYVPLLLFLRQHVQTIMAEALNLADLAHAHFSDTKKYPNLNPPPHWFAEQLDKGKCMILLDGLDEVADLEQRRAVSAWVDQQIISYPRCRFIVTSRPQGYLTAPVEQANVLEVQAFNTGQVRRFIHAWYLANEVISFGEVDDGVRNKAKQEAEDLLQRLRAMPTLSALTVNPLLLTMIAMVHRYRGQLPGRRVELYAEICDVLLGHWQEGKKISVKLTAVQKRVALQPLAAQMMERNRRDIRTDEAIQIITEPLKRVGLTDDLIQDFLKEVQASSGLFLEGEVGEWRFAHLTFQEYLAATYFLEQQTKLDWHAVVNDSWWHETLRLYAAQADATLLVQACLDNNNIRALTLAADCLEEARELDAAVRSQVERCLIDDLESDDLQRRQLAAEVRLNQRLKSLQRIDEQREIDLKYLTCAEYQLFLDEKRAKEEYYQPDHWTAYTFPKGSAQEPIRGIRAEDAKKFCEWLTQKQGSEVHYRLPLPTEAMDYPPKNIMNNLATWCQEKNFFALIGLRKEEKIILSNKIGDISELPLTVKLESSLYVPNYDINLLKSLSLVEYIDFTNTFYHVHELALTCALDRFITHSFTLDSVRSLLLFLAFNLTFNEIYQTIKENNFQKAKELIQTIQKNETNLTQQRLLELLDAVLTCVPTMKGLEARKAWRHYLVKFIEYILVLYYEKYEKKATDDYNSEDQQVIPKFYWWLKNKIDYSEDQKVILNFHWWLKIIMAREEGKLPAWEGIRIVREREPL